MPVQHAMLLPDDKNGNSRLEHGYMQAAIKAAKRSLHQHAELTVSTLVGGNRVPEKSQATDWKRPCISQGYSKL